VYPYLICYLKFGVRINQSLSCSGVRPPWQ